MSNFKFLKQEWSEIYQKVKKAEDRAIIEPMSSASYCRLVLEECVFCMYDLEYIDLPFNTELHNLLIQNEVKELIPFGILNGLHIVRKTGNSASHFGKKTDSKDAITSLRYLYDFLKWYAQNYNSDEPILPKSFVEIYIPKIGESQRKLKELKAEQEKEQAKLKAQIEVLIQEKEQALIKAEESEQTQLKYQNDLKKAKAQLHKQKQGRKPIQDREYTEAETRKHLIDIDLKEAGWSVLRDGRELEYPVTGMPITADNPKGNGFADYVLWDNDGSPLAVIEAKRTTRNAEEGRHQAFLYANCLEKMHGQRPIIFYSNGYHTYLWNDRFYSSAHRVYGFYTIDELQWLIQQRRSRKDIRQAIVNPQIANRPYQIEAIQRIAEIFVTDSKEGLRGAQRQALLVMATGSGKTRTAAALVEIFLKYNWVKRVLFLADRNALVRQAKGSFAEHLPEISSIDLTEEKENDSTRMVFSTYPSMMNRIDSVRSEDGRFYSVGHFDLIIVDEAHRSVYNRYQAIFNYFDALIVGLTATPKDSIDHNTYEIFGCSSGDPTFSYELEQAVPTYLCRYENIDISTEFLREGIKYKDLSEKDKEKYEASFMDSGTGLFPEEIKANAMNKWLFNKDTVDKVLDTLMEDGIKIEGGDELGRTIIFAVNQKHAEFIVKCFNKRYPYKPSGYIATIHNKVSHSQSLIDAFCDHHKENLPQIVVSVDMMDTGIDAPRVLNLLFFKVVRSYAKFWQMIGRGTRLSPNIFGPGQDKDHFLIFDVCQNFEFFEINRRGNESLDIKSITQQIFQARLQLSRLLAETGEEDNLELSKKLLNILHASIKNLDRDRFQVDMVLEYVVAFEERAKWDNLSSEDVHLVELHLSGLPIPETINEVARRFDLMFLKYQISVLMMLNTAKRYQGNFISIAEALSAKYSIPQVLHSKRLIENMKDPDFYKAQRQMRLEEIREEIRELVQFLESSSQKPIYTYLEDSEITKTFGEQLHSYGEDKLYKRRVESYIRDHKHHITISKLSTNKPISTKELEELEKILFDGQERGSKEDFIKYGDKPLGEFIRSIIGLDISAAQEAFADFLRAGNLRADQMTFVNNIINYLTQNGTIDKRMLFESPFTDVNDQGLLGVFNDAEAGKIIRIINEINENAMVG